MYVNTTDATVTTAASFQTSPGKAYGVTAKVVAMEIDESAFYIAQAHFRTTPAGVLSIVGAVNAAVVIEGTAAWAADIDASGTDIRVRVTGAAATNITWLVDLEVIECGKYYPNQGLVS